MTHPAVKVLRALLTAQRRSAWNRIRSESGLSGIVATYAVLGGVALVLAVPGVLAFRAGYGLGAELAEPGATAAMLRWNALQALFTVGFAALGSLRYRPSFPFEDFGRFPIPPFQLLLAEIPAALFEVFPLLGAAGILCSNLGLALRMPAWSPLVAVLAVQGLAAMLALLFLAASVRRIVESHRRTALATAVAGLVLMVTQWQTVRAAIVAGAPGFISWLPGSQAYAALAELSAGYPLGGAARLTAALAATAVLVLLAGRVHDRVQHRTRRIDTRGGWSRRARFHFGNPASALGRLFNRQLLDSKSGKILLIAPLTFTLPLLVLAAAVRFDAADRDVLPETISRASALLAAAPLFSLLLLLTVLLDSQIWMNQFGWDRAGIRTLLLLPIPPRTLLLGKLSGLLRFASLQVTIGAVPLLFVHRPSAAELLTGIGAGGIALVVAVGAGHWFSVRYPRAVPRDGTAAIPLYLAWVPTVLVLMVAGGVQVLDRALRGFGPWPAATVFLALLAVSVGFYSRVLDDLAEQVRSCREHLLGM